MQPDARFSTYSGAPSLQPSLAPTMDTTSNRSSTTTPLPPQYSSRFSEQTSLYPDPIPEKSATAAAHQPNRALIYGADAPAAALGSSLTLFAATDPRGADIKSFASMLDKMAEPRLDRQRYVMSGHKTEEVAKIALGAKVERALARRMTGQDAVFTSPPRGPKRKSLVDEKAFEAAAIIRAN